MAKYATGKYAKAISDRSGLEFPYREMLKEWNGSLVHVSEYEAKQPQLEPKPHGADGIALRNVRPDRVEPAVAVLLGNNPFSTTASSTTVTVTEKNHGRTCAEKAEELLFLENNNISCYISGFKQMRGQISKMTQCSSDRKTQPQGDFLDENHRVRHEIP